MHLVKNTSKIKGLHTRLINTLDEIGVSYTVPQYIGNGHKPHVSKREGDQLVPGHKQLANTAYLIEVEIHGEDHLRFIRAKFDFKMLRQGS